MAAFRRRIGNFQLAFLAARNLEGNGGIRLTAFIAGKGAFQPCQPGVFIVVSPEEEAGVGRMIIGAVKGAELFITQVQHLGRVAAGVEAVQHVREDGMLGFFHQHGIRGGIDSFHFIEDHTLVAPAAFLIHVDMPPFLTQHVLVDAGMEHGVDIDVHKIIEIPQIGAGYGVTGLVRKGQCVEKSLERTFKQLHEGFLHRIFFRAAENGVFQNVRHAGGIFGRSAETDAEGLVFVVIENGKQLRAGDVMLPEADDPADLLKSLFPQEGETVCMQGGFFHQRFLCGLKSPSSGGTCAGQAGKPVRSFPGPFLQGGQSACILSAARQPADGAVRIQALFRQPV